MSMPDLEALAARIAAPLHTSPGGARFLEIVPPILALLARGKPVPLEEIAAAAGTSPEAVRDALGQVSSVEWDEQGRVVGAGLTLVPTPHRLEVEGKALFAWCALDTLMYPALLGRPARIESPCRGTGEPVRITATPNGIESLEPPSAVVSVVEPKDIANIRSVFCENVHFFASPEAASRWLERHPDATILPVEDAFRLGRRIAEAILDPSRSRSANAERERTG
ncbi:MAG: organomercurial lyase MerB [Chloroflexota bacterium]